MMFACTRSSDYCCAFTLSNKRIQSSVDAPAVHSYRLSAQGVNQEQQLTSSLITVLLQAHSVVSPFLFTLFVSALRVEHTFMFESISLFLEERADAGCGQLVL